jgi:hypothetical protein
MRSRIKWNAGVSRRDPGRPVIREDKPVTKTAVAAAIAGNALEFYDFVIYAFFAVCIGKTFFPAGNEAASLLASVAVFGVGFFTAPLGGVAIFAVDGIDMVYNIEIVYQTRNDDPTLHRFIDAVVWSSQQR